MKMFKRITISALSLVAAVGFTLGSISPAASAASQQSGSSWIYSITSSNTTSCKRI